MGIVEIGGGGGGGPLGSNDDDDCRCKGLIFEDEPDLLSKDELDDECDKPWFAGGRGERDVGEN